MSNIAPPELIATDQPARTGTDEKDFTNRRQTPSEEGVCTSTVIRGDTADAINN